MLKKVQLLLDFEESLESHLKSRYPGLKDFRIISKALDARGASRGKRPAVSYSVEIIFQGDQFIYHQEVFKKVLPLQFMPIIVGTGPAGIFLALRLLEYGIPSLLLERGDEANKRMLTIGKFWRKGQLDPDSNICYGEGGAGLFSDGKLITRVKSPFIPYVMQRLVDFGAPSEVAYTSNPHLGSNKIRPLIAKLTQYLKERGCIIRYRTKMSEVLFSANKVSGVRLETGEVIYSNRVILATGHSATEIYLQLKNQVELKAKDYAVGVRIEHPRALIDRLQHGEFFKSTDLGAARYRLSYQDQSDEVGTYSFCMCPGGHVLSSGTEKKGLVVNGMSNFARNSPWSNAALVVAVKAGVDYNLDIESAIKYQHTIEEKCFSYSQIHASGKEIPAQRLMDFLQGTKSKTLPHTSCPSGIISAPLYDLLPKNVVTHLQVALEQFNIQLKGFKSEEALLLAPETRTSSPITIVRDPVTLQTSQKAGLYPCGEGAGYAGGITSAACDGVKVAEAIVREL